MATPTAHENASGSINGQSASGIPSSENEAVGRLLASDASRGAAVHSFNPDSGPEEKAAAAGKDRGQLAAVPGFPHIRQDKETGGRAVTVDTSTSSMKLVPTVTIEDVDRASREEGQVVGADSMPGHIPAGAAPPIPTWMQTGWRQAAGLDQAEDEKAQQISFMANYLSEQAYGSWFHNAGIILFSVLATRFSTVLGLGWGWVILILAACSSYYTLSISRTRQRARDDIQRELVKTRLVTETESADWLNGFLDRFWLIYEPVLSQTIVASVDSVLATSTPAFLESIRLTTFTLGTKAPRIDFVRTFPKTPEDVVIMDWALSFTPNDLQDITPRQAAKRVNPKIVLSVRVGKGAVSKSLPILLEDMSFTGRMRIKLKLMTNFPHVQTIDLSFIEKPTFDYVLKPLGGDSFGFDINNIPGLAPFIREQVHANLGPMMYDPNVFSIDLQALLSGNPLDSAIGVLKVHIIDGRGLKAIKLGGGAPDAYVSIALGAKPPITQTKVITSTSNPSWNETQFILINTLADVLSLNLFDYNEHRPDNLLGTVTQELSTLLEDAEQEGMVGKILGGGKDRGELRYDLSYFPVLQGQKNADGTHEPVPDTQTGIVRLVIHQAKDLDITRLSGDLNPFASVMLGGSTKEIHRTTVMKHANQPIWESACEFLVPDKQASMVTVRVTDAKDFASDPSLGFVRINLLDLLEARERQQDWWTLTGSRAGKVRLTAEWKPVAMTGSLSGAAVYVPPIGILRLWLKKAQDVKNVEAALGGKSDPYVRVMGSNKILARTEVVNNNLNPEWDQVVYVPIHNLRENLILEVMDFQNIGKDRSLGYVEIKASDFAIPSEGDARYPYASKGVQEREDKIRLDKANSYKGTLLYEGDFKPAMSLKGGVSFDAQKNEIEVAAEEARSNGGGVYGPSTPGVGGNQSSEASGGPRPPLSVRGQSTMSGLSIQQSKAGGEATAAENPKTGVDMSVGEIMTCQSGVLVVQVISGQLARRGSLEIMLDDGYWPSFTSTRARSSHATWDQIGEGFVRELEFSRIWLRLNAADDSEKEDIVAEFRCDTKEFLDRCLREPTDFLLSQADGSGRSVVRLSARYVPVDIRLEPRESINNMGVLRVDVISAKGLLAVDRSGKSDPYVTFTLNGTKVFKSETKKKTVSPVWNEAFEVMVPSRDAARFGFEISDWDRIGTATHLGFGEIDLATLEPFETIERDFPIRHEKGHDQGTMSVRMLFQPEIIARSRQKTMSFSNAGRAITTIGGMPIAAGKGVVHGGGAVVQGVGHGLESVGGFAGRRFGLIKKKDKSGKEVLVPADGSGEPAVETSEVIDEREMDKAVRTPVKTYENGNTNGYELGQMPLGRAEGVEQVATDNPFVRSELGAGPSEPGILAITVLGAKDLKGGQKPYVQVKVGGKVHKTGHVKGVEPEWNETFSFNVLPGTERFAVNVYDHHTMGKDEDLGEAEVDIWRHIQPSNPGADVDIELEKGTGLLRLHLEWTPGISPMPKSLGARGRTASIGSKADSPSRFHMMKRKDKVENINGQ